MARYVAAPISGYNLTLQKATAITAAVFGNFSKPKVQEIVVARGKLLELLRPDDETGRMQCIHSTDVFGGDRDYIAVGSDSGRLVILSYNAEKQRFDKVHDEVYGKTGCRRIVPGQYLAVDPKGRAICVAAIEKQKLVYVLNRDAAANLTISSPLEAHKSHTLVFAICGVDVGFDNPIFACIEADYENKVFQKPDGEAAVQKALTYYELDLGLNHVTRKWTTDVDETSNLVVPVPGGSEGPGGVIVCAEGKLYYKNIDHVTLMGKLPVRFGSDERTLITSFATHTQKDNFFFLLQSEHGDIFRVTLEYEWASRGEGDAVARVQRMVIKYLDTVPPTVAMCILKTGFLFCASEVGNHYFFQVQSIGDDDDTAFSFSEEVKGESEDGVAPVDTSEDGEGEGEEKAPLVYFNPRKPVNLALVDEMESMAPIIDMKVVDLTRELTPQIYTLCGQGSRSTLRVLRHGLAVSEVAVSDLPGNPSAVWAVKRASSDPYMSYIVVSFSNATIVLSIGETVVEVTDSGILGDTATLSMSLLGDNSLLQVHAGGLRHIRADKRINQWNTPGRKSITRCAVNSRQVVIALTGGELVYFELDKTGQLMEVLRKELGNDAAALAIAPVPEGRTRALFMAVGGYDNTVRMLSLEPNSLLSQLTVQAVPAQPSALQLVSLAGGGAQRDAFDLYLFVGLANGVMIRSRVEDADGSLSDARKRFLGTRPVKLTTVQLQGQSALLALSTRSYATYTHLNKLHTTPLSYDMLEHSSAFISEQCPEGLVCIGGNQLRIVTIDKLGELFNQTSFPLRHTPRRMIVVPAPLVAPSAPGLAPTPITQATQLLAIIESDHNAYTEKARKEMKKALAEATEEDEPGAGPAAGAGAGAGAGDDVDMDTGDSEVVKVEKKEDDAEAQDEVSDAFLGAPKAGAGKWASVLRIVDPTDGKTLALHEFEENEAAFSVTWCRLGDKGAADRKDIGETFLVVGSAKDMTIAPRSCSSGFLTLFRVDASPDGQGVVLRIHHKTPITEVPAAICGFQNRLLVGAGKALRLYEMGKRKMLRKCENRSFPTMIQSITTMGERIYVGDVSESFHYCCYKKSDKQLYILCDSLAPRFLTASALLDYDTMAGADKFGNLFVSRLNKDTSEKIDKDPTGGRITVKYGSNLNGAPHKLTDLMNFHVGDMITSLQKTALVPGGAEVLLYGTMLGAIGVFLPFSAKEDIEFFAHLEMHLRQEVPPLCGRDHLAFRSYYFPVKDCTDGDLCETFTQLDYDRQQAVAEELVSTPQEVARKLEELRNRLL